MMIKRNSRFAALSIAVAASAIGAGAVVSGNAMAGSSGSDTAGDTVTMAIASTETGDVIECTFDGVELPSLTGVDGAAGGVAAAVTGEVSSGDIVLADGAMVDGQELHELPEVGDGTTGRAIAVSVDGEVIESEVIEGEVIESTPLDPALFEGVERVEGVEGQSGIADGGITAVGGALPAEALPEGTAEVLDAASARQGTADECAAMLEQVTPAP